MNPWLLAAAGAALLALLFTNRGAAAVPAGDANGAAQAAQSRGGDGSVTAVPPGSTEQQVVQTLSAEPGQSSSSADGSAGYGYSSNPYIDYGIAQLNQPAPPPPPPGIGSTFSSAPPPPPPPGIGSTFGPPPPPPHAGNISN